MSSEGDAESERSVQESEDSSADEEDTPDSWREVPGTCTLVSMGRKSIKLQRHSSKTCIRYIY